MVWAIQAGKKKIIGGVWLMTILERLQAANEENLATPTFFLKNLFSFLRMTKTRCNVWADKAGNSWHFPPLYLLLFLVPKKGRNRGLRRDDVDETESSRVYGRSCFSTNVDFRELPARMTFFLPYSFFFLFPESPSWEQMKVRLSWWRHFGLSARHALSF